LTDEFFVRKTSNSVVLDRLDRATARHGLAVAVDCVNNTKTHNNSNIRTLTGGEGRKRSLSEVELVYLGVSQRSWRMNCVPSPCVRPLRLRSATVRVSLRECSLNGEGRTSELG